MATVSEELRSEGTSLLSERNAEEIQKLGDRILSVEPDNWYGLFIRGCGYALEHDFSNTVSNWKNCLEHVDDDETVVDLCPMMIDFMTECINHLPAEQRLDFSQASELLNLLNDKLPESDDEIFVNSVLSKGIESLRNNEADNPMMTYFAYKALAITSFRSYVELKILRGFLNKVSEIKKAIREYSDGKMGSVLDNETLFLDEMDSAMSQAIENTPGDKMEKIEEYWLEHKKEPYVSHVLQAYQMSAAVSAAGKITSKLAKKVMMTEIRTFVNAYLSPKI